MFKAEKVIRAMDSYKKMIINPSFEFAMRDEEEAKNAIADMSYLVDKETHTTTLQFMSYPIKFIDTVPSGKLWMIVDGILAREFQI